MFAEGSPPVADLTRIGWVLLSSPDNPIPSTRVAVLNMLPRLRPLGFDSRLLFAPTRPSETPQLELDADRIAAEGLRLVCFQKVHGPSVLALAGALRRRGIRTAYVVCDLIDPEMARATDATIVVTDHLKQFYPADVQPRVHVVHDGIERPEVQKTVWRDDPGSAQRPLHALLVTSALLDTLPVLTVPPPWLRVTIVGRCPTAHSAWQAARGFQWRWRQLPDWRQRVGMLRFAAHPRIERVAWHPQGVYDWLQRADIGILPVDPEPVSPGSAPPVSTLKSENRLTLKMSVGLPVIATPVPSYLPVVDQGRNAYLANDRAQWLQALSALRDPAHRRAVGHAARESVSQRYSMDAQAQRLAAVLRSALARAAVGATPLPG